MNPSEKPRYWKAPIGNWQLAFGNEFLPGAGEWPNDLSRRGFLRLAGATLALAGFNSCTKQPFEKIVPYVKQPEEIIPGKALRFATATQFGGFAQGLLVTSHEGRPTKIEGNPNHPASLGATTIWAQADVLDLYDPDRAQTVVTGGSIKTKDDFWSALNSALERAKSNRGAQLRILTEPISSPTLLAQLADVTARFPAARWCVWDPLESIGAGEGICDFSKANIIVSLDSDFLCAHPFAVRYARDFAGRRRVLEADGAQMSRFYAAEPTPTTTGSNADHRIAVASRDMLPLAQQLAINLGLTKLGGLKPSSLTGGADAWLKAATTDLTSNRGAGIIVAGGSQPPEVHAMVAQINATDRKSVV